jgi:hypothetical protein
MVNGQSTVPQADGKFNSTIYSQSPGTFVGASMPPGGGPPGEQQIFSQDPTDRTNMGGIEALFISELLRAHWYDANHNTIPPCSLSEASAFSETVITNLLKAAPTKEAFLINLAALAGSRMLWNKDTLQVTRLEELSDRTRYSCVWELRFGDIVGNWTMEETVMHERWKKTQKDDGGGTGTAGGRSATPNGTNGSQADHWERKYKELAASLQERDEELMRLKAKVVESVRES